MRKYIVETPDGEWLFPKPKNLKNGKVTLDKKDYALDPKKMRRYTVRPARYLWLIKREIQVQLWKENVPDPVPLFDHHEPPDGLTGEIMAMASREHRIREVLGSGTDLILILLLLSVVGNIILGVGLFYLQQNGGI